MALTNKKNLSVFVVRQSLGNVIQQYTYHRPGEPDFISTQTRFQFQNQFGFPAAGIDLTVPNPIVAVNQKGASGEGWLMLLAKTTGGTIAWKFTTDGGNFWNDWAIMPGNLPSSLTIQSGLAVSAYNDNRLVLVVRASNNQLYRRFYDGANWGSWVTTSLGAPSGGAVGDPTVIGFPLNGYRVYIRNSSGLLYHRTFNGSSLGSWTQVTQITTNESPEGTDVSYLDDNLTTPLSYWFPASGSPINQQDEGMVVFYRDTQNGCQVRRFAPSGTVFSANFSGGLTSSPAAAFLIGRVEPPFQPSGALYQEFHAFVKGNDNLMYGRYVKLEGNGSLTLSPDWYHFGNLGQIVGKPAVVAWDGVPNFVG